MIKFPARLEFEAVNATILEESLDEHSREPTMRVQVKWQHGGIVNRNGRLYTKEILQREIDRLQEQIGNGEIYGASYHPATGVANINDVSHIWNKVWMDENGECYGECTVLPTRTGKDAMVLIKHGRVGVSSRGAGTVTKKTGKVGGKMASYDEVNKDFRLLSPGDFVLTPSVPDARVRTVMEDSMSDAVSSYISENKHLFIESQEDETGDSKSNSKEEDMEKKEYENIDALKADYDELFTAYEEALKADMEKQVEDKVAEAKEEWTKEVEEKINTAVEAVKKSNETMVEGIRDAINVLTSIEGVIPEEENTETPEGEDGGSKEEDLTKTIADLKAKTVDLEKQISDRDKAEQDAKDREEAQSALRAKLDEELEKEENVKFKDLIEKELVSEDGDITHDDVETLPEEVTRLKEKFSDIIAEGVKNKIIESGLEPKGTVKNEESVSAEEAEKRIKTQFAEAKKAGFKGTIEEFKSKVLINS
jgi:hypothetical protein